MLQGSRRANMLLNSIGNPARFATTSWLLALAGIWAALQLHADLHEHVDLPPALHLLRDGSLGVPMAAIAIAIAGVITPRVVKATGTPEGSVSGHMTWIVLAALLFAAFSVPGNELHGFLFGAEEEANVSFIADALFDGTTVLVAALMLLVPASVLGVTPWPRPAAGTPKAPTGLPGNPTRVSATALPGGADRA